MPCTVHTIPYPEEEPDPEFDKAMTDLLRSLPPNLRSVFLATVPRQLNSTPLPLVEPVALPDSTPLSIMVYVPSRLLHHFPPSFPADITEADFRRISESEFQKLRELMMMLRNRAAITCLVENIVGVDFNLTSHLVHGDAGSWGWMVHVEDKSHPDLPSVRLRGNLETTFVVPVIPGRRTVVFRAEERDGTVKFDASVRPAAVVPGFIASLLGMG